MLKNEFGPEHPWFEGINVLVDLGYQGIQKDYAGKRIEIPHKKPRKSNKNPEPELTAGKKPTIMPWQWRILIENAISGIKRFNILVHAFRNRKTGMEDDAIALGAGLWNFLLA